MPDPLTPPTPLHQLTEVAAALTAAWIRARDHVVEYTLPQPVASALPLVTLQVDGSRAALAVAPLYALDPGPAMLRAKTTLEERLAGLGLGGLVVWTPPLADLPSEPPPDLLDRFARGATGLGPEQRREVGLPATLGLRRSGDDGSYLNALGGLQPHWARFTNRVAGQYLLDSTAIHRLPEDTESVDALIESIVQAAAGLEQAGQRVDVPAADTWIIQRLREIAAPIVLAASPDSLPSDGRSVRKALRRGARAAAEALAGVEAELKIVTFVGIYRAMAEENATIALRGMDPILVAGFDLVCLAADGRLQPMFGPKQGSPLNP